MKDSKIQDVTIVLPTKDHEQIIYKNFESLNNFCKTYISNYEILIISNGSKKTNLELITKLSAKYKFIHTKLEESGKGLAVRYGMLNSKYDNVLIYDSDFSYNIEEFLKFFDSKNIPLAPFVHLKRKISKNIIKNTPIIRIIAGITFNLLIRIILKINSKDTQAGFKFIQKSKFKNCTNFKSDDFLYDVELFLLARNNHVKAYPIDIDTLIKSEHSNVGILKDSLQMFLKLFKLRQRYKLK